MVCFKLLLFVNRNWAHHDWMVIAGIDKHWMLVSRNGDIKVTQVECWVDTQNCALLSGTRSIQVVQRPVAGQNCHRFGSTDDYSHKCFIFFP